MAETTLNIYLKDGFSIVTDLTQIEIERKMMNNPCFIKVNGILYNLIEEIDQGDIFIMVNNIILIV